MIKILIIIFIVGGVVLFVRSHIKWLDKQSPVGIWTAEHDGTEITIQFEQESGSKTKEGIYKQIMKMADEKVIREFGHWISLRSKLRMLILANEIPNHPRFGQDTEYTIYYTGNDRIRIDGPDRPNIVYKRAPDGTIVDLDMEEGEASESIES